MSNFTAIDFETATGSRASICQVGIVLVENCEIVNRIERLVRPPDNLYHERNIAIHGITPDETEDAETFDKLYEKIKHHIEGKNVVAHNAKFDIDCLMKTLAHYKIKMPMAKWFCTRNIYKESLSVACKINNISLSNQHNALSDAEACALLMIKDIKRN